LGVEFRVYLIPRDNTIRPGGVAVSRLIASLRHERFVHGDLTRRTTSMRAGDKSISDVDVAALEAGEVLAFFQTRDHLQENLQHPLVSPYVDGDEGGYCDLEFRFSDDFVANGNEYIDPIDETCRCGTVLGYWPEDGAPDLFYSGRIHRVGPRCGEAFKPQERLAAARNAMTGDNKPPIRGGLTYRFAIVVDCGKSRPMDADAEPTTTVEFKRTCERCARRATL